MSLSFVIVICVIFILGLFALYFMFKNKDPPIEEEAERTCHHCRTVIPKDYKKSLCPNCNKFLM